MTFMNHAADVGAAVARFDRSRVAEDERKRVLAEFPSRNGRRFRWIAMRWAHLVSLVRAGARFENGVLAERGEQTA